MLKEETLQSEFMTYYEDIANIAHGAFRHLPEIEREEAVAEVFAGAWQTFLRYREKASPNASFLTHFPIQSVRANMKFTGCDSRDIMSGMKSAQRRPSRANWRTCNPTEIAGMKWDRANPKRDNYQDDVLFFFFPKAAVIPPCDATTVRLIVTGVDKLRHKCNVLFGHSDCSFACVDICQGTSATIPPLELFSLQ